MWYLVIETTMGVLDMSKFEQFFRTKKLAEQKADEARACLGVVSVEVKKKQKG